MTPWSARSSRSALLVSLVALAVMPLLPAGAHAQTLLIGSAPSHAVSVTGSIAAGEGVGRSPGLALAAERQVGRDLLGRLVSIRLQGGSERLRVDAAGTLDGAYVRRRHAAIGLSRSLGTGGIDPYVFAQLRRHWLVERQGSTRVDGVGFGAGIDVAPIGSRRSFMVELELGLAEPARLPSGRYVEGVGTSRLQVGYKRRF
jgi:hypothetical protein